MTTLPRQERNHLHSYCRMILAGHEPTKQEIDDLRMVRARADAILKGESLDDADVYMKAFRPPKCIDCEEDYADLPSKLCPGCEAYREHTA